MGLELRLLTRGAADRVVARRRDSAVDPPWAAGYPLEGDTRACVAYASHLPPAAAGAAISVFGYYQLLEEGVAVGGIGFHGPPTGGAVEVGYGVVPVVRGRGVATAALRRLLAIATDLDGVQRVVGRTEQSNVASQRVMVAAGMQLVGRDPDFLHYEIELSPVPAPQAGVDPGRRER